LEQAASVEVTGRSTRVAVATSSVVTTLHPRHHRQGAHRDCTRLLLCQGHQQVR
jgi:hypothetical protein